MSMSHSNSNSIMNFEAARRLIRAAIQNADHKQPGIVETMISRLNGMFGPRWLNPTSLDDLINADWHPADRDMALACPSGHMAIVCKRPGYVGYVSLDELRDGERVLTLRDRGLLYGAEESGELIVTCPRVAMEAVEYTVAVLEYVGEPRMGIPVLAGFSIGRPYFFSQFGVKPEVCESYYDGDSLHVYTAKVFGATHAFLSGFAGKLPGEAAQRQYEIIVSRPACLLSGPISVTADSQLDAERQALMAARDITEWRIQKYDSTGKPIFMPHEPAYVAQIRLVPAAVVGEKTPEVKVTFTPSAAAPPEAEAEMVSSRGDLVSEPADDSSSGEMIDTDVPV